MCVPNVHVNSDHRATLARNELLCTSRVGQNHTFIGKHSVHTVLFAGNLPYIRSYTVQMYCSGQPYACLVCASAQATDHCRRQ
jgi:hypothetical protein